MTFSIEELTDIFENSHNLLQCYISGVNSEDVDVRRFTEWIKSLPESKRAQLICWFHDHE